MVLVNECETTITVIQVHQIERKQLKKRLKNRGTFYTPKILSHECLW